MRVRSAVRQCARIGIAVRQCARIGIAVRQCARIGMGFEGTSTVSLPRCLTRQKSDHRLNATRRRSGEKSDGEKTSRMLVPLLVIACLLLLQT